MKESVATDERRELAEIYDALTPVARERLLTFAKSITCAQEIEPAKQHAENGNLPQCVDSESYKNK